MKNIEDGLVAEASLGPVTQPGLFHRGGDQGGVVAAGPQPGGDSERLGIGIPADLVEQPSALAVDEPAHEVRVHAADPALYGPALAPRVRDRPSTRRQLRSESAGEFCRV